MDNIRKKRKRIIVLGSLLGGGMAATIFFLLDILFADFENGTWREAIVNDLNRTFSASSYTVDSFLVLVVYAVVFALLVAFGAFMGIVFCLFLERFFSFLKS